jgi:hypothetical protein
VRLLTTWSLLAASIAVALVANADTATLAGRWSATALRADWSIGDWGPKCGPRPSGGGAPGGTVIVKAFGSELSIAFPGRAYGTTECWEQFPGLTRVSHTGSARSWKNVCKTGAGDVRQASVVTTISATDAQIQFDETGQYQFVTEGQNCTASARRTRSLTLIHRDGEPEPAASAAAPSAAAKAPREARCKTTGLPERLEVRPSRKLMRPGEEFAFRAAIVDAAGCPLPITPTWRVVSGASAVELTTGGKVTASRAITDQAEARIQATVGDRFVNVDVEIVSQERYDSLLKGGTFNAEGESSEAAITRVASSSIGARSGVARDEARGKRVAFVAVIGGLSFALGVVGLLIMLRGRRNAAKAAAAAALVSSPRSRPPLRGAKVCPTCREEYPEQAEFCPADGNRLVESIADAPIGPAGGVCPVCGQGYDPGVTVCPKHQEPLVPPLVLGEARRASATIQRICPVCGTQYPGDSQFCGQCGAALVPVN